MKSNVFYRAVAILALSTLAGLIPGVAGLGAHAQGIITGGIVGSVTDPTGAVIPNASITFTNDGTGTSMQVKTNSQGGYVFSDVPLGIYTVTISAGGFSTSTVKHVQVVAGQPSSLGNQQLNLGTAVGQTIQVEAGASQLINTESAQMEISIDSEQVSSAPDTGALDNQALIVPGVVNIHMDGNSNTNGINFSVI